MSAVKQQHESLKKEAREISDRRESKKSAKAAKAKAKAARPPRGSKTVERVRSLLTSLKAPSKLISLAVAGASRSQLNTLRDGINAHAETLREKKKAKSASALSAVNRLVRRLARAGR